MNIKFPTGTKTSRVNFTINSQKGGSNTNIDDARLALEQTPGVLNMMQVQDGIWGTKWGTEYYSNAIAGETTIDGATEYIADDDSREIVAVGGTTGKVWKSTDDGKTWTQITGATMTPGHQCYFMEINYELWITNSTDRLTIYDGTDLTRNTALANPTGLAATKGAGLTTGSLVYFYSVVGLNSVGFTEGATEVSASVPSTMSRDTWSLSTQYVDLSCGAVAGAIRYEWYISDESGSKIYLDQSTTNSYRDDGKAQPNIYREIPSANTTGGPILGKVSLSDGRVWGVDTENKWLVFGGTGQYMKYFSYFYGGGYTELEKGGRDTPSTVMHYRSGKGDSMATAYTSSPDGKGSIWQIAFDSITVGSDNVIIPMPVKIVGSIGSSSPLGVFEAKDNILAANKKGLFALRNKAQLFNVLATDEQSVNIRPSWRSFSGTQFNKLVGYYFEGKAIISGSVSGTSNDTTTIYDLERNNWTWKWDIGYQQFFEYTDTANNTHLLAVLPGSSQLVRISENISKDLGQDFNTQWLSPLIHADPKDHSKFGRYNYAILELGRPKGTINFEVIGTEKNKTSRSLGSRSITDTTSSIDFCNALWGDYMWGDDEAIPKTFSQATLKKAIKVRKKLNNIQFLVSSKGAKYSILSVGITDKKPPQSWFK